MSLATVGSIPPSLLARRWPLLGVVLIGMAVVGAAFTRFHAESRQLWTVMDHDRNAHYWAAHSLALDLRHMDVGHFVRQLERSRVWGPLHPFVTSFVLAIGGTHYEIAVLTSLVPWVLTAILAFLCVRRAVPWSGDLGGAVAALLVLGSPAFQAFATDIMLESLGACLTLAAVFAYLRARQEPTFGHFRWVALALTALFLLKYQYWLLVLFAMAAVEGIRHLSGILAIVEQVGRPSGRQALGTWIRSGLSSVLNWLFAFSMGVVFVLAVAGPRTLSLGSKTFEFGTPRVMLMPLWFLVVARMFLWWRGEGRRWLGARSSWFAALITWHAWPVAVWFLLPKRLSLFIAYLTRDHGGGGESDGTFLGRVTAYSQTVALDYHSGMVCLMLVAGLAVIAFTLARRLRPGSGLIFWLFAVSVSLTLAQPTCRSRFVHSWLAIGWVMAGIGLSGLACAWPALAPRRVGVGLAWTATVSLLLLCAPATLTRGQAPEGGVRPEAVSMLDMADRFLPGLEGTRRVVILSNYPLKFFAMWTYEQRFGRSERVIGEPFQFPARPADLERWLQRTPCDAVVWIEVPMAGQTSTPGYDPEATRGKCDLLLKQGRFVVAKRWDGNSSDGCAVTLWRTPPKGSSIP